MIIDYCLNDDELRDLFFEIFGEDNEITVWLNKERIK